VRGAGGSRGSVSSPRSLSPRAPRARVRATKEANASAVMCILLSGSAASAAEAERHPGDLLQPPAIYRLHAGRQPIQNDLYAGRPNDP
jgi:hypothetical protein